MFPCSASCSSPSAPATEFDRIETVNVEADSRGAAAATAWTGIKDRFWQAWIRPHRWAATPARATDEQRYSCPGKLFGRVMRRRSLLQ